MKQIALAAFLALLLVAPAGAQDGRCTREVLAIKRTPVTVAYCVLRPGREATPVSESFSSPKGSFTQTSLLAFIPGADPSRVIEDVSLSQLGLSGTLHLTLVMHAGAVHIEAAILTPGAITIK